MDGGGHGGLAQAREHKLQHGRLRAGVLQRHAVWPQVDVRLAAHHLQILERERESRERERAEREREREGQKESNERKRERREREK